jgi:hypothetical protein
MCGSAFGLFNAKNNNSQFSLGVCFPGGMLDGETVA